MKARRARDLDNALAALAALPMGALMVEYLRFCEVRNFSLATLYWKAHSFKVFAAWCEERGLRLPQEVTKPILERFQRHQFLYRKRNGRPLGWSTQYARLSAVKMLFRWLVRQGHLLSNPASELQMPKMVQRLPAAVLSKAEVDAVMRQPDLSTAVGVRDRAVLEVLYSTGMRRKELAGLLVADVDAERGTVMIRDGKGHKDRLIPIGERALAWVEKYQNEVRPQLVTGLDEGVLFLTTKGERFLLEHLSVLAAEYVAAAELGKRGACHLFRHSMATAMLEGGADIRFIQAMLGHADLSSTAVYTRVAIQKLKDIHTATHPAAKLERKASPAASAEVDEEEAQPALLASLEVEADEEKPASLKSPAAGPSQPGR